MTTIYLSLGSNLGDQLGSLDRKPRGRIATQRAFEYFQVEPRGMTGRLEF